MKLKAITELSEVKKFLDYDAPLASQCLTDEELSQYYLSTWWPDKRFSYVGAYYEDELIAILSFLPMTNITAICHLWVSSDRQGSGKSLVVGNAFEEWLKDNTQYYKLIIQTPNVCQQVLKYSLDFGFKIEAMLAGSVYWREEVRNMILLTKYIDRSAA